MTSTSIARRLTIIASAALILGLTACTPGSTQGNELTTETDQVSKADWDRQLDDCLTDTGFDIASLTGGQGGAATPQSGDSSPANEAALNAAIEACTAEIGAPPIDESLPTADEAFEFRLNFASCMREEGYAYPDPVRGNAMADEPEPEADPEAVAACSARAHDIEAKNRESND